MLTRLAASVFLAFAVLALPLVALGQGGGSGLKPSTTLGKPPAQEAQPAPAAVAPADKQTAGPPPKSLEEIFACLAEGLTQDWRSATIEVIELASDGKERKFETRYAYTRAGQSAPQRLKPCDDTKPAMGVHAFNEFLEPEKRLWKRVLLTFRSDGKFDLKYDYTPQ